MTPNRITHLTHDGSIGTITLLNTKKHNALSHQLVAEVIEALTTLATAQVRVVILRAPAIDQGQSQGLVTGTVTLFRCSPWIFGSG
jgi:enoyl-CoA hydratase/carnithine racemase